MVCKKRDTGCLISLFNHIGIETGNRKELESISRIGIGIDKIQTIPNPITDHHWLISQEECRFFFKNKHDYKCDIDFIQQFNKQ